MCELRQALRLSRYYMKIENALVALCARIPNPDNSTGTALEPPPDVRVWPGDPYPLGATWTGVGVNFALFSAHATKVELCLFDSANSVRETHRIPLIEHTDMVW